MADAQGAATAALAAESGARTDRLELLQQLNGGSVGVVHKARNPKLNRTVALRQVQVPEWLDDVEDLIKRILAEARAASALDHPNIARLYTGGYKGFTVFLTSEFIEGVGIKEFIAARNMGVADILGLGKQLCSALDYAHQKQVIHYALNPSNLRVLPDGTLKVLDFGLLREKHLYSPTPAKRLESEHYLSPEQLKSKPVNQAANIFSLATILYELFTTRNPFAGKHLGEVDRNIIEIEATPASLAHARVSEAISKVLMKGLAKHALARFQSCAEFSAALEDAVKAPARAASSATSSGSFPKPAAVAAPKITNDSASSAAAKPVAPIASNGQPAPASVSSPAPVASAAQAAPAPPAKPAIASPRKEPVAPPSKMPVKMLTQWKLVGGIVAAVFVISAVAISLNHRSTVQPAAPDPVAPTLEKVASQDPVAVTVPDTPEEPAAIDVRGSQPRASRQRVANTGAVVSPAAVAEGQLSVSSDPAGATISIEGRTMDSWKTPQVVGSLAPAVYKVSVSKPGYATETRTIQVVSGKSASLDVKLTALKAILNITGTPLGARIVIDGKETGKFSPAEFTLDPAIHTIALHREGFFDNTGEVKLAAGQTANYSPSLTPAGRTDNIKVVGGFKKMFGGGSSAGMSRLEIRSDPKGAQVSVNGNMLSKTTPVDIQVEPGNYEIVLQKEGYKPARTMVTTAPDDKVKVDEQLQK